MERLTRIRSVSPVRGFVVKLEFTNGTAREVNLERYLKGQIFEPLRSDPARFREVRVDTRAGTICWPNGADIDPDVLYHGLEPAREGPEAKPAKVSSELMSVAPTRILAV
jgi:hypothetical protein